jgi:hypothetical protein
MKIGILWNGMISFDTPFNKKRRGVRQIKNLEGNYVTAQGKSEFIKAFQCPDLISSPPIYLHQYSSTESLDERCP